MGAGLRPMVYRVSLVDAETHIMNPTETRHGSGWGWQECAAALCHAGCCVLAVRVHGVSPVSAKLGGARLLPAAHTRAPDLIHACVPPCPQNMSRPVMVLHPGGHLAPAPDPFDPMALLPAVTHADKRWGARGGDQSASGSATPYATPSAVGSSHCRHGCMCCWSCLLGACCHVHPALAPALACAPPAGCCWWRAAAAGAQKCTPSGRPPSSKRCKPCCSAHSG